MTGSLRRSPTLIRWVTTLALTVAAGLLSSAADAQSQYLMVLDRPGYLAGEVVAIHAEGFAPFEWVSVRVSHPDVFNESGAGHDPFWARADARGRVDTQWALADDRASRQFLVEAAGATGTVPPVPFERIATLDADRTRYQVGDIARVKGHGFWPAEWVSLGGYAFQADSEGRIASEWTVSQPMESYLLRMSAVGNQSGLVGRMALARQGTIVMDDRGPDDVFGAFDMQFYRYQWRRDLPVPALAVDIGYDDDRFVDAFDYPSVLIDTNGDGLIDREAWSELSGPSTATTIWNARHPLYIFSCNNTSTRTCGNPVYLGDSSTVETYGGGEGGVLASFAVTLADLRVGGDRIPTIVNVCGADCINERGSGLLTVDIATETYTGPTTFMVALPAGTARNGRTAWSITPVAPPSTPAPTQAVGTAGTASMAPGVYQLAASLPAGWHVVRAWCDSGEARAVGDTLLDVFVRAGQEARCKFVVSNDPATYVPVVGPPVFGTTGGVKAIR